MHAAHAESSGEGCDECGDNGERNQNDDQQRETGEQGGRCRLKDRVDHSDDCVEESHRASGR